MQHRAVILSSFSHCASGSHDLSLLRACHQTASGVPPVDPDKSATLRHAWDEKTWLWPMKEPGMRILGVDPGLQVTGYAVLETTPNGPDVCEAGVIRSSEKQAPSDMAQRVRAVYDGIGEVIEQFRPSVVAVEQLYAHYEHPRTAILMAHARGVIFLAAAQHGLPVISYNATRIKKTITGSGRASKEQVQRTVQRELNLATPPEPPDVADAIAVALCHYYVQKMPA
jgi:crossover junction endodeoxyribonuclease RuvC